MDVLIAGAGPAGLCLGHGLRRHGIGVRIHERTASGGRALGYRVNLDTAGRMALDACLDAPTGKALAAVLHQQSDPVCTVRTAEGRLVNRQRLPGDTVAVDRTALQRVLARGLGDAVRWEAPVVDLTLGAVGSSRPVTARFGDGTRAEADVLVGADGSWSTVRGSVLPGVRPGLSGVTAVYGRTRLDRADLSGDLVREALTSRVTTIVGEGGDTVVLGAWAPGPDARDVVPELEPYLMWVLLTTDTVLSGKDPAAGHAFVRSRLHGWLPDLCRLVAAADPGDTFAVPLVDPAVVPAWPSGTVTLIGDAAHPMSPAGGQGANLALVDAARLHSVLAEAARRPLDLGTALAAHDHVLREAAAATLNLPVVEALQEVH